MDTNEPGIHTISERCIPAFIALGILAAYQEQVRVDERKRIARDIDDDLGQHLLVLGIDVSLLGREIEGGGPDVGSKLNAIKTQVDNTIVSVRAIINQLRPPMLDDGLRAAIERHVAQMNRRSKVRFSFVDTGHADVRLEEEKQMSIFRIVQEAMSNVVRHANATCAVILFDQQSHRLTIEVSDNGRGAFPNDQRRPRSFGLIGIRERARAMGGDIALTSAPERGTTVSLSIPLDAYTEDPALSLRAQGTAQDAASG